MIALARVDDTRFITIDDGVGNSTQIEVPDIKIPQNVEWRVDVIAGGAAYIIYFNNRATLWDGPHTIGQNTFYIVDAPRNFLILLRNQLGETNVYPLIRALRNSAAVRSWAKANGFTVVRNDNGQPVSIMPRHTICGTNPIDLDGEEMSEAQVLADLD